MNDSKDNVSEISEYEEETVAMQRQHGTPPQPEAAAQPEHMSRPEPAPRQENAGRPVPPMSPPPRGSKKKWILPLVVVVVLALIAASFLIVPAASYRIGVKSFDAGNYAKAAQAFKLAGSYQDAKERAEAAKSADAYERGRLAFEDGDYAAAAACFKEAGDYEDAGKQLDLSNLGVSFAKGEELMQAGDYAAAAKKFAEAKSFPGAAEREKEAYGKLAAQLLDQGSYGDALKAFLAADDRDAALSCVEKMVKDGQYSEVVEAVGSLDDSSFGGYLNYSQGMIQLSNSDFDAAIDAFGKAKGVFDAETRLKEAYYQKGESLMKQKRYDDAAQSYKSASGYSDAETKITTCSFLAAEEHYADGSLNTAKELYEKLPSDFSYDGVTVAERLATLEKFKAFLPLCGTWDASDNANQVKTICSSSQYYWVGKPKANNGQITVKCVIGSDGKVTVRGEVEFVRYSNYSIISSFLRTTRENISFDQTVNKANFTFKVGDLTLSHSANGFRARWQVKEKDGTATNTYSADYTYNNQKTLY